MHFNSFYDHCSIIKIHCQHLLQLQNLHGVFTACTRCAHNAPTAPYSRGVCFEHAQINPAAWRSRRLHSVSTALLASGTRRVFQLGDLVFLEIIVITIIDHMIMSMTSIHFYNILIKEVIKCFIRHFV